MKKMSHIFYRTGTGKFNSKTGRTVGVRTFTGRKMNILLTNAVGSLCIQCAELSSLKSQVCRLRVFPENDAIGYPIG
jgi:hypothetical protein